MIGNETIISRFAVDVLNKKVTIFTEEDSIVTFKCSTINELVELKQKCARILKTENFVCW
jgi:hypothetical protein